MGKKSKKEVVQVESPELSVEEKALAGWQAYLEAQQRGIQRVSLQRAVLGEPTEATRRRGKVDGEGELPIVLEPPVGVEPWVVEDEGESSD